MKPFIFYLALFMVGVGGMLGLNTIGLSQPRVQADFRDGLDVLHLKGIPYHNPDDKVIRNGNQPILDPAGGELVPLSQIYFVDTVIVRSTSDTTRHNIALKYRRMETELASELRAVPITYSLLQNYPNPFNPTTKIQFTIVDRQSTIVNVFDVLGRDVATLVNEVKQPGTYAVEFDGSNLSSVIYFYRLTAGDFVQTRRLLVLR